MTSTTSTSLMISTLHGTSQDSNAFTNETLLELAKELLVNFATREQEWSTAGNWVAEDLKVLKLHPESKPLEEMDDYAYTQAAAIRAGVSSAFKPYLTSTITALENQIKMKREGGGASSASSIELVDKKRTIETAEGSVEVHGPVGLPIIPGISFETWSKPSNVDYEGYDHDDTEKQQGVCLVLGAGNQPILSAVDTMHSIFNLKCPVLLKHHPVRPYLIHPYAVLFQPLLDKGYMEQILDEGIPKTKELLSNELVTHVHITGAYQTVAAIQKTLVETRKDVKTMKDAAAMVTSELGCATPFIFAPAVYEEKELRNAAKAFVTSKKYNGGSNCLCGQVIVLPKEWPQNAAFRRILLEEFAATKKDPIYYPGSLQKRDSALSAYNNNTGADNENNGGRPSAGRRRSSILSAVPSINYEEEDNDDSSDDAAAAAEAAEVVVPSPVGVEDDDVVLVECGTPGEDDFNGYSLQEEAFGPVVAVVELPGGASETDPVQYMTETVAPFCNDKSKLFGTLSCTLLWPESIRQANTPQEADTGLLQAIASLQYGTIAVNAWSLFGYLACMNGGIWGGHPRDLLRHSGSGFIGNCYGLPVEKQVVYASPLTTAPLIDKNNPPPAIVQDCIHALSTSSSMVGAMVSIWMLLVIRAVQFVLPKFLTKWILGERKYGAAL